MEVSTGQWRRAMEVSTGQWRRAMEVSTGQWRRAMDYVERMREMDQYLIINAERAHATDGAQRTQSLMWRRAAAWVEARISSRCTRQSTTTGYGLIDFISSRRDM